MENEKIFKMRKKQIIFVEAFPTIMVYKIAKIFRKKGYETILIRLLEITKDDEDFKKDAYDKIIALNLNAFKFHLKNIPKIFFSLIKKIKDLTVSFIEISKLKPYVIIGRANPSWPIALIKILFKKIPLIYFPYDIRFYLYANSKMAMKKGDIPNFEIKAERYCFKNVDGIIHKGDPNELAPLERKMLSENSKICPNKINFQPYCFQEFIAPINKNKLSKKDGKIHLAFLGAGISRMIFKTYEKLIAQKIHIHAYSRQLTLEDNSKYAFLRGYPKLLNSKYFHFHEPLNPKDVIKDVSKYDFGLYPIIISPEDRGFLLNSCTGNKFSSYLEAGLPMIYSPVYKVVDNILKKYDADISVDDMKGILLLKKRLKRLDYKKFEKKIIKLRKDYTMEKQFPRLEKFIKKVVEEKKFSL